jgi:hypothetical protein
LVINVTTCPHLTPAQLARFAPAACALCSGWVDVDGTVMDAATARARYPQFAGVIPEPPAPPTRGQVAWHAWMTLGKLAWTLLLLLVVGVILAGLIAVLITLL